MAVQPAKSSNRIVLIIGILSAALAFGGVLVLLRQGGSGGATHQVVVAKADIEAGAVITPDSVKLASLSDDTFPADVLVDTAAVAGKIAAGHISMNTPIVPALFQGAGTASRQQGSATTASAPTSSASMRIDKGHVALAIPASLPNADYAAGDLLSVGYYIQAGDHIDILVDPGGPAGAPAGARYSFQDVIVLRAGAGGGPAAAPASSGSAAAATTIPAVYVVELPRAQAEELTALLTHRGTQSVLKYVLRPQEEYGKAGAPNYQDAGPAGLPAKQDQTVSGEALTKLFPR